ncbi:MAG: hypothetical protein AAGF24_08975 [Cyanobacteria bacterium P01_H01_bin.121]
MSHETLPDDIHELLAGYVLGDLDSAEAEQLQRLLQQQPELQQEIYTLQAAFATLPYGLEPTEPQSTLKSNLLQHVGDPVAPVLPAPDGATAIADPQTVSSDLGSNVLPLQTRFRPRHSIVKRLERVKQGIRTLSVPRLTGSAAAALLVVFGVSTILQLHRQVEQLEARLAKTLPDSELIIEPANSAIATLWPGIQDLIQDHLQSVQRQRGVADVPAAQMADLASPLNLDAHDLAHLPTLPYDQGLLIGGSNCQLGKTKGVRLSYRWLEQSVLQPGSSPAAQTISAYQLQVAADEFPQLPSTSVALKQADGVNALIWKQQDYVYALVAELPLETLEKLAHQLQS